MHIIKRLLLCLAVSGYVQSLYATDLHASPEMHPYLLAQNEPQQRDRELLLPPPASGSLILPGAGNNPGADTVEKKCMTVCAQWGEECNYINRGSAGTTRSCRRTCQQYKEECF